MARLLAVLALALLAALSLSVGAARAHAEEITAYLAENLAPTTEDGEAWDVALGELTVSTTGNTATAGIYQQVSTTATPTPSRRARPSSGWSSATPSPATSCPFGSTWRTPRGRGPAPSPSPSHWGIR